MENEILRKTHVNTSPRHRRLSICLYIIYIRIWYGIWCVFTTIECSTINVIFIIRRLLHLTQCRPKSHDKTKFSFDDRSTLAISHGCVGVLQWWTDGVNVRGGGDQRSENFDAKCCKYRTDVRFESIGYPSATTHDSSCRVQTPTNARLPFCPAVANLMILIIQDSITNVENKTT